MKSTIFTKILEETIVEVKTNKPDAINKLILQNGKCRNTITEQENLWFYCHKNGKFLVSDWNPYSSSRHNNNTLCYYVKGRVVIENGKTLVKIYSIYSRSEKAFRYITIGMCLLVVASFFISFLFLEEPKSKIDILSKLILAALIPAAAFRLKKQAKNHQKDLEVMKDEAVRRAEAINFWDK